MANFVAFTFTSTLEPIFFYEKELLKFVRSYIIIQNLSIC